MKREIIKSIDDFYKNEEDFVYFNEKNEEILWTDFTAASEFLNENPDCYCYTSFECDNAIWLVEGYHYVNRLGYIITRRKIEIPEEGLKELEF